MEQLFDAVNGKILRQQSAGARMRTTAVFLAARGARLIWGHVGNSRMYHYLNGTPVRCTIDHSVPQLAMAMGEIRRDQIPGHPGRNAKRARDVSPKSTRSSGRRYSPVWPDGKKHARNVYAHSEEECEKLLAELIVEMKAEIRAEKERLRANPKAG